MEGTLILAALSYAQILAADDLAAQMPADTVIHNAHRRARLRRVEADYRYFISTNPAHVPAMVAYGGFLYDQGRQDEAVSWWQRALQTDPTYARAYNDLATHYGHTGRLAEAFRYHERAIELEPTTPVFYFNWANTCIMFRVDARRVYGWSEDEIFRRSLDAFRRARDLAPQEYEYAEAYAESFYLWPNADWNKALEAWEFCRQHAPDEQRLQRVYSHFVRVCLKLGRDEDALNWLSKIEDPGLRRTLERKFPPVQDSEHDEQNHDQRHHPQQ